MFWIFTDVGEGNLVRTERTLDWHTIDIFRACPALRSAKDDHRPGLAGLFLMRSRICCARILLNFSYACVAAIESIREKLVHDLGIVPFNEARGVAVSFI